MLAGAMSLSIGRSFLSGPNIAIRLPRPCSKNNPLFRISENSLGILSQNSHFRILSFPLSTLLKSSIPSSPSTVKTYASFARSGAQKTSWDEAADSYFSEETEKETPASKPAGVKKWKASANRERQDFGSKSDANEGDRTRRTSQTRNSESVEREREDVGRRSGYGGERNRTDQWQRPAGGYRSRDGGAPSGRSGSDWQVRGKTADRSSWGNDYNRGQDERAGFGDHQRWQAREYSPPLLLEGQALYGVAPIISALQVSRRTFYCLYMQENLLLNIGNGKRKDKAAVTAIERMARGMGVTVKEASKHDLNMLVDNRPHQGLILDASPLELIPVDTLDAPAYLDGKPPVWVALDEVTDPQNFGAILRSAYFLGAEGVVVCAKNSAPLSGVVSKASAGAMEVMEVLFCRNMVRFLEKCKENSWRVVGAAAEHASVPVRQLPHGIATVLVLGSEGKGLRTNVKRSCDQLVSIAGVSNGSKGLNYNFVAQDFEDEGVDVDMEEDEEGGRRGAESGLIPGPSAVDSLNVSVAAGILLYELLDSPTEDDVRTPSS